MGAILTKRQRSSPALAASPPYPKIFTHAVLTAGAALALVAGLPDVVNALPLNLFGDARATPRPVSAPTVRPAPIRTATTMTTSSFKGQSVGKPAASLSDLAAKAKGPLRIIISLDRQQLTLYSGDEVIAHSRVSSGQRGHSTPTGVFSIIQKDRWHRSNLYDDAPMYFMQRLTWSGVALHQGIVPNYPASHGCIRLPEAFAQQLWTTTRTGARVIVSHGEIAPVAITHVKLFAPKPAPAVASKTSGNSVQAAEQAWKLAQLDTTRAATWVSITDVPTAILPALDGAVQPTMTPLKPGPVSVFISRKESKLFVRKGFEPVFDVPVAIDHPELPLGTHVFTAMATTEDSARWSVVSMTPKTAAADALDRIAIPPEAIERISSLMTTGASLIITDHGLGPETGTGTDFIVVNP
jgi:lipoprotein-anchoring transpeptidase ErfK/SrfK